MPLKYRENVLGDWLDTDRRRPGRKGRSDLSYATWARAYVRFIEEGERNPVRRLADEQHLSSSQIRTIIGEARRRDLLTEAKPGKAGGQLTEKCVVLLTGIAEGEVI